MEQNTQTIEQIVDGQLMKLEIPGPPVEGKTYQEQHNAKIKALEEEAAMLPQISDEATLATNQKMLTRLVNTRTGIDKARKLLQDPVKKMVEKMNAYLGTDKDGGLQKRINDIERPIEERKKAYLSELERKRTEAERLIKERFDKRTKQLTDLGMKFDGNTFSLEEFSALASDVRNADEERFALVMKKLQGIVDGINERNLAAQQARDNEERERQEEAERLRKQKEEQDAAARKIDEERIALRNEKRSHRIDQLVAIGANVHWREDGLSGVSIGDNNQQAIYDLVGLTDQEWTYLKANVKADVVEAAKPRSEPSIPIAHDAALATEDNPSFQPEDPLPASVEPKMDIVQTKDEWTKAEAPTVIPQRIADDVAIWVETLVTANGLDAAMQRRRSLIGDASEAKEYERIHRIFCDEVLSAIQGMAK